MVFFTIQQTLLSQLRWRLLPVIQFDIPRHRLNLSEREYVREQTKGDRENQNKITYHIIVPMLFYQRFIVSHLEQV